MRWLAFSWFLAAVAASAEEPLRVDLHVHFTMNQAFKPLFKGESGAGKMASSPGAIFLNQVDVGQLAAAGVRVVVASVWPPLDVRPGLSARDEAVRQLDGLRAFAARHPEVHLATSAADARAALAKGKLALFPAVEGGEGITSADDVDVYFAHGARLMTVVHMLDSGLAGSADGQLTRILGFGSNGQNPQGLSPLGRAVVVRMISLGMAIDIAHASDVTADEILTLADAAGAPVFYTHGSARALHPMERSVSDEIAMRVARSGGLIGVTLYRDFLTGVPQEQRWSGFQEDTCDAVAAHWKYLAQKVGPDAVVLGSDFNGMINRPGAGGSCPAGIRTTEDLPALFEALRVRGLPQKALDQGGERFLEAVEKAEGKAESRARQEASRPRPVALDAFDVAL